MKTYSSIQLKSSYTTVMLLQHFHKLIVLSIFVTGLLFFTSCKEQPHSHDDGHAHGEADHEAGHEEGHDNETIAKLTTKQMESIDIQLGSIEKKQLTASLRANGILKVPNQNKAFATTLLGGVVNSLVVQAGSRVTKGQTIASITNMAFITLQEEYLRTTADLELAEIELARQQELREGNAGSVKAVQQAENVTKTLKTKKASLQRQLDLIGINTDKLSNANIQTTVSIRTPIAGVVSDVLVNIGSYVDPNNPIAEIVDNSQLHLDLYVYEKDLAKLKVGQTIHFTLTNNPGKEYDATIFAISNTFEEETKAVAVHAQVKGDKTNLIDGMSITALISLNNILLDAIPSEAIVNHQGQDYIFIVAEYQETGGMSFEKIPVRKGTTDVGFSEITLLSDIPDNAKIVTNGAFFLMAKLTNQGEAHEH